MNIDKKNAQGSELNTAHRLVAKLEMIVLWRLCNTYLLISLQVCNYMTKHYNGSQVLYYVIIYHASITAVIRE